MGQRHARIYSSLPQCKLVAVADTDLIRSQSVANAYGCESYGNVSELLDSNTLDAVSVTVPTISHTEIAEKVISRGIACLIEKPLASSYLEALRIVEQARSYSTIVQVGHIERFNPAIEAVSKLGIKPLYIKIDRVSPMPFRSLDVDVVLDIMIHDLDLILMFTNAIPSQCKVEALGIQMNGAPAHLAQARLSLPPDCLADITASRIALRSKRRIRIFTSDSYINIDCSSQQATLLRLDDYLQGLAHAQSVLASGTPLTEEDLSDFQKIDNLVPRTSFDKDHQLRNEIENFLLNVQQEREPSVNIDTGLKALELADMIKAGMRCLNVGDPHDMPKQQCQSRKG